MSAMKCFTCGQDMPASVAFCGHCGAPAEDSSSPAEVAYGLLPMVSFTTAVKLGFERYFNFHGRSTRAEYWWWFLFCMLADVILSVVDIITGTYIAGAQSGLFSGLFGLFLIIPSLALGSRRLHDINRTGWWQLMWLGIFLIVPAIVLIVWAIKQGDEGPNKYGPHPRQIFLVTSQ